MTAGRPLGIETGGKGLRVEGSFAIVDEAGAEAVDFGDPEVEVELSDSDSEFEFRSPAASLFNIFLMSIHALRPLQAGSPAPDTQH